MHLLLNDETRGFLSRERIAAMRPGALLVNTARGALVDEAAMIEALRSGQLGHAGLDVFEIEPLPTGHVLTVSRKYVRVQAKKEPDRGGRRPRRRALPFVARPVTLSLVCRESRAHDLRPGSGGEP